MLTPAWEHAHYQIPTWQSGCPSRLFLFLLVSEICCFMPICGLSGRMQSVMHSTWIPISTLRFEIVSAVPIINHLPYTGRAIPRFICKSLFPAPSFAGTTLKGRAQQNFLGSISNRFILESKVVRLTRMRAAAPFAPPTRPFVCRRTRTIF